ncbi:MAG: hypothetical protein N4A65_13650 [Cohaesibacter sp.]|jgi:hypothetical protein|nr:hypothetical protein [Cohaesibacter sp.]
MAASSLVTLFVLTAMAGGGHSTAYTTKESMEACKATIAPVEEILTNGGVKVISIDCVTTSQKVTQFKHRPPKDAPRVAFLNVIDKGVLTITAQDSEEACQKAYPANLEEDVKQICSTSKQQLEKD